LAWSTALLLALSAPPAQAQDQTFRTRATVTGDWGGGADRALQQEHRLEPHLSGEVFGNLSGGIETGAAYEDLISLEVDTDLQKLMGWKGGTAHVSLYQIDDGGRNAADLGGSISDPSNIDARPTFRLFTLWVQQQLGDTGSLRVGQLAADDEFLISDTAAALINGTFGWANIVAANLPGGGPGYPLATPGDPPRARSVRRGQVADGHVQRQSGRRLPAG
jgi:porin